MSPATRKTGDQRGSSRRARELAHRVQRLRRAGAPDDIAVAVVANETGRPVAEVVRVLKEAELWPPSPPEGR